MLMRIRYTRRSRRPRRSRTARRKWWRACFSHGRSRLGRSGEHRSVRVRRAAPNAAVHEARGQHGETRL